MGYIYKITNIINNKIYIGLTTQTVQKRWSQHINTAYSQTSKDSNELLKKAIRKYGINNFIVESIDEADTLDELKEKECYWIKQYNSYAFDNDGYGYNMTRGGDSPTHEQDCVAVKRIDILTGQELERFPSIAAAERTYNRGIHEIIHGHVGQVPKGSTWKRVEESYDQVQEFLKYNIVCQLDLQGNFIRYWLNVQDAAQYLGNSAGNIRSCLVNNRGQAGGYQWCYYKDLSKKLGSVYINQSSEKRKKKVGQYDLCDNLIVVWDSATEAAKNTNTNITKISAVCNGHRKTSNGFKWRYIS